MIFSLKQKKSPDDAGYFGFGFWYSSV